MKLVLILLLLANTLYPQPLKFSTDNRHKGYYAVFNGTEFFMDSEGYRVKEISSEKIYRISGRKVFFISENREYCAIANFAFNESKEDYPVTIDLFNRSLEKVTFSITAPYDLPHPGINISDDGEIILFDPLTYKVEIYSINGKKDYIIKKDVESYQEHSFFTISDSGNFYLLISEKTEDINEGPEVVYFYSAGAEFENILRKKMEIETPVFFGIADEKMVISGVDFKHGQAVYKTFILDGDEILERPFSIESLLIYEDGFAAKFGNSVYVLNKELNIISSLQVNGWIKDLAVFNNGIQVLLNDKGWRILSISKNMNVDFDFALDYLSGGVLPRLQRVGDNLLLYDNDYTYILNEFVRRYK
jgi:hypothetical protein